MGVSTRDIFGDGSGAQPATPGSYGEAPSGYRLPQLTRLGPVHLRVSDLPRSVAYYEGTLGLQLRGRDDGIAALGPHGDDRVLVHLHERKGVHPVPRRGRTGLYHFAILLPDRPSLGRFIRHLGEIDAHAGSADHLVSESLYLQDPDNLGIEIYRDRPRDGWRRIGRELMMATDPLDVAGLLEAAGEAKWTGMPAGTAMGHLHLHVGDIARGTAFYGEGLGFDRTVWEYPGALFLAAGGYHHHLGTNTWAGSGATPAEEDEAQLLEWTIELPGAADVAGAAESLTHRGFPFTRDGGAIVAPDPWGTPVRLTSTRGTA